MTSNKNLIHARRRLLKALGITGSTIGISVLSHGWKTPVVNAVLLPAHAATSGLCRIRLVVNMDAEGSADYSGFYGYTLTDGDMNTIESDLFNDVGVPINTSIDFDLPPGTYFVSLSASIDANTGTGAIELRGECCGDDFVADETSGDISSGISLNIGARVDINADGTCSIEPADVG